MRDRELARRELRTDPDFPRLASSPFEITSDATPAYNCIAWALGETTRFWTPTGTPLGGYYWPPDVPRSRAVDAWAQVFEQEGYVRCDSTAHEPGIEKIAIFGRDASLATHVARQLPDGAWTSKLGNDVDISHPSLAALIDGRYGQVAVVLCRTPT